MTSNTQHKEGRAISLLEKVCRVFALTGGAVLIALSVVTVLSVLGRYFFNSPISGDFEMVEIGCAIAVATFLPYCQLRQGNVIVDFFTHNLPDKFKNIMDAFGCILVTLMAFLIAWRSGLGGYDLFRYNDQTMILQFPTWLGFLIIIPCFALLTLVGLVTAWRSLSGRHHSDPFEQAMDEI